jgi:hypothetical protein
LKNGVGGKGRIYEGIEPIKVKHTHRGHTLNILKVNLIINNENQDCKIGTVCAEGREILLGVGGEGRRLR